MTRPPPTIGAVTRATSLFLCIALLMLVSGCRGGGSDDLPTGTPPTVETASLSPTPTPTPPPAQGEPSAAGPTAAVPPAASSPTLPAAAGDWSRGGGTGGPPPTAAPTPTPTPRPPAPTPTPTPTPTPMLPPPSGGGFVPPAGPRTVERCYGSVGIPASPPFRVTVTCASFGYRTLFEIEVEVDYFAELDYPVRVRVEVTPPGPGWGWATGYLFFDGDSETFAWPADFSLIAEPLAGTYTVEVEAEVGLGFPELVASGSFTIQ